MSKVAKEALVLAELRLLLLRGCRSRCHVGGLDDVGLGEVMILEKVSSVRFARLRDPYPRSQPR